MAFNSISLNSVLAPTVSTVHLPYFSEASKIDILFHLGSGLQTTSFSQPNGVTISITNTAGTISFGAISDLTNKNSDQVEWSTSTATIQIEFLTNYEVDISSYEIRAGSAASSNYWNSWIFEGSDDAVTWTELDRRAQVGAAPANFDYEPYHCDNRQGFFKYIRWRVLDIVGNGAVADLYLYGKLRNLVTGNAGTRGAVGTMANFPDIDAARSNLDNRIFIYDGATWELRPNTPWVTQKLVLDGTYAITSGYQPTYYFISPNGAARDIILPNPQTRDTIRIKNLDGLFDLSIYEFDPANTGVDLVGYWDMDEASGTRVDSVGTRDLSETGATSRAGLIGNETEFVEASFARLTNTGWPTPTGNFSWSAWATLDTKPTHISTVVSQWNTTNTQKAFRLIWNNSTDRWEFQVTKNGSSITTAAATGHTPSIGVRYHLVATYDSSTGDLQLYIDGELEGTGNIGAGALNSNATELIMGASLGAGGPFADLLDGAIDEVGYWSRVLNQTDIDILYNSGSGETFANLTGTPPTPVILNNAGKLQYEFVYDGTEWLVTG